MEEMEISSWKTLDTLQNEAEIIETIGDLQTGHWKSVFCMIEDDYLELCYIDTVSNFLRHFDNKEEFEAAIQRRKEEEGEVPYENDSAFEDSFDDKMNTEDLVEEEDPNSF